MEALQRAMSYLDAVEVAPNRYAFRWLVSSGDRPWFTIGTRSLEKFGMMAMQYDGPAAGWVLRNGLDLSIFFRELCRQMPAWWSPTVRMRRIQVAVFPDMLGDDGVRFITADLNTGKEVPA